MLVRFSSRRDDMDEKCAWCFFGLQNDGDVNEGEKSFYCDGK